MKQGASLVASGSLPVAAKKWRSQATRAASTPGQSMTSTAGLRQAGAKKWVTVARPGCSRPAKMRAAGSELVLDVITASLATRASTSAKIRRLSARSSVAASSTQSQPASAS